jgi:hypothetical protein
MIGWWVVDFATGGEIRENSATVTQPHGHCREMLTDFLEVFLGEGAGN